MTDNCKKAARLAALQEDENKEVFEQPEFFFPKYKDLECEAL